MANAFAEDFGICEVDAIDDCDTNIDPAIDHSTNSNINFYYFYTPTCKYCAEVKEYFEKELLPKYNEKGIKLNIVSVNRDENNETSELFINIIDELGGTSYGVPAVVINNKLLHGANQIKENLETEIDNCLETGCELYSSGKDANIANIGTITLLALADSINPCAIAVLLILLSVVLMKFSKKEVLKYGFTFIATIFISYLIMGLILIFGFKAIGLGATGTTIFYIIFGILAILMGILNLKDGIAYGAGNFIMEVPMKWRPTMKRLISSVTSLWSVIIVALLISFFLLPCTAGPYFVVSGILQSQGWTNAFLWLIYYNLIFILPMLIITLLVYFGFANLGKLEAQRNIYIKHLHLVAGLILLAIGIYLILYAI
jgi:glutaredoxin